MRLFRAALVVAFFVASVAAPAYAQQQKSVPRYGEEDKDKTEQEKAADKAAQQAYQRSLGNIPDQGPTDPWGAVRGDAPKASAAKAKKTKTGSTAN
jgi:hypothetical protein